MRRMLFALEAFIGACAIWAILGLTKAPITFTESLVIIGILNLVSSVRVIETNVDSVRILIKQTTIQRAATQATCEHPDMEYNEGCSRCGLPSAVDKNQDK